MNDEKTGGTPMAWDEPGGGRDREPRDPWGGGRRQDGPPELDEVIGKVRERLRGLFGGGKGPRNGGGGGDGGGQPIPTAYLPIVALFGGILVFSQMFYAIQPGERGVVTRFGKHVDTLDPGWRIRLPRPIERVQKVNIDLVRSQQVKGSMFTKDGNIAVVDLEVQYRIKNAAHYLFNVKAPDEMLRQATEAALRETVGANTIDFTLTEGRQQIAQATKDTLQQILDTHGTGIIVNQVNSKDANPPAEVKDAFDDAIKADQDYERLVNEAEAYKNEILPKAGGAAARQRAEAEAYKQQVIARAEGEANRFRELLAQYRKTPDVTRERLYLETMESVLNNSSKVVVDSESANQMLYLPLDRLVPQRQGQAATASPAVRTPEDLATDLAEDASVRASIEERDRAAERARETR
jgi:membrane protease subunit HflK